MIKNFTIFIVLTFIVNTYANSAFDVAESQSITNTKKVNTIKSSSQKIKSNYKKKLLKNLIRRKKIIESR